MTEKKLKEAVFVYDDNIPGILTSEEGLLPGRYIVVMYKGNLVPIENIVRFGDDGYVSQIEAVCNNGCESEDAKNDYKVEICGIGPSSGSGSIVFKDGTGDTYSLAFCSHKQTCSYIRFNSARPILRTIAWTNPGPIKV